MLKYNEFILENINITSSIYAITNGIYFITKYGIFSSDDMKLKYIDFQEKFKDKLPRFSKEISGAGADLNTIVKNFMFEDEREAEYLLKRIKEGNSYGGSYDSWLKDLNLKIEDFNIKEYLMGLIPVDSINNYDVI